MYTEKASEQGIKQNPENQNYTVTRTYEYADMDGWESERLEKSAFEVCHLSMLTELSTEEEVLLFKSKQQLREDGECLLSLSELKVFFRNNSLTKFTYWILV